MKDMITGFWGFSLNFTFENLFFCWECLTSWEKFRTLFSMIHRSSPSRKKIEKSSGDNKSGGGECKIYSEHHLRLWMCARTASWVKKLRVVREKIEKELKITKSKKIQWSFLQFAIKTVQVADSDSSVSENFLVLI